MDTSPAPQSTNKLEIENALLHNNEQLRAYFDTALEKYGKSVSEKVSEQTQTFAKQVFDLTKTVAAHDGKFTALDIEVNVLKGAIQILKTRFAVVGSVCTVLGGLLGFFIAQLVK